MELLLRMMSRRRSCLECFILLTVLNLVAVSTLVWYHTNNGSGGDGGNVVMAGVAAVDADEAPRLPPPPKNESLDSLEFSSSLDRFRLFKCRSFLMTGSAWSSLSSSRRVCLGTQTSVDRLHWLLDTVDTWSGPVSVAVFAPDLEYRVFLDFMAHVDRCQPGKLDAVAFHIVFPVDHPPIAAATASDDAISCEETPARVSELLLERTRSMDMMAWRERLPYPQNLLRNLAKSGCQTEFTLIPDVDMIPNPGLDLGLEVFLDTPAAAECDKCAFVIPTYEVSSGAARLPATKDELVELVAKGKARQFHQAVYKINQKSSDLPRWLNLKSATGALEIGYQVSNYIFRYEPLYVARANETPPFDERFIGFGMTRNTQAYEMYVSGFSFNLLSGDAFTSHWGFQTVSTRPQWRAEQQQKNNRLFDDFAKELVARYGGKDPYGMMAKLKGLNLKNAKVAFGKPKSKS